MQTPPVRREPQAFEKIAGLEVARESADSANGDPHSISANGCRVGAEALAVVPRKLWLLRVSPNPPSPCRRHSCFPPSVPARQPHLTTPPSPPPSAFTRLLSLGARDNRRGFTSILLPRSTNIHCASSLTLLHPKVQKFACSSFNTPKVSSNALHAINIITTTHYRVGTVPTQTRN